MKAPAMPPAPAPMMALSRTERFLNRAWTAGDPLVAGLNQLRFGMCSSVEMVVDENLRVGLGILANTLCAGELALRFMLWGVEVEMRVLRLLNAELNSARLGEEREFGETKIRALPDEFSIEAVFGGLN